MVEDNIGGSPLRSNTEQGTPKEISSTSGQMKVSQTTNTPPSRTRKTVSLLECEVDIVTGETKHCRRIPIYDEPLPGTVTDNPGNVPEVPTSASRQATVVDPQSRKEKAVSELPNTPVATPPNDPIETWTRSDAGQKGSKTLTVRKVRWNGKLFFEILKPDEIPEPVAEETPPIQKTQPSLRDMRHRFSRLKGCSTRSCPLPNKSSPDKNKQERNDKTVKDGDDKSTEVQA